MVNRIQLAISYQRWSTKGQDQGDSRVRQSSAAEKYAAKHGLVLDDSFVDEGVSAFKGKNASEGRLAAFLQAVDDGMIPSNVTLLVESLDRISRANIMDALPLFMSIVNRGVRVVTLADNERVYTRESIIKDNGMSLFASMMVLIRAHEESATKSMRVKSAKAKALEAGKKHGKCPFWLKVSDDRRSFIILEKKADIVRECFRMRRRGIGSHTIALHLNKKCGFKYGTPQAVRLLQNPAVIGTRLSQVGLEPLIGYYPEIVDKALYYEVQHLMGANIGTKRGRKAEDEPNLFTGLLRCSKCGGAMRFFRPTKTVSQAYVRCLSALTSAGCKVKGFVNYDALENDVIGWLLLDQDEALVDLLDEKPTKQALNTAELQSLKEQQERLIELAALGLRNTQLVANKLNAIEQQIRDLSKVAETPPSESLFAEKSWALVERHDNARFAVAAGEDPQELYAVRRELKAMFARSLGRITVFPEKRVDDIQLCEYSVAFRGYEGEVRRLYDRPSLTHVKGVYNVSAASRPS